MHQECCAARADVGRSVDDVGQGADDRGVGHILSLGRQPGWSDASTEERRADQTGSA